MTSSYPKETLDVFACWKKGPRQNTAEYLLMLRPVHSKTGICCYIYSQPNKSYSRVITDSIDAAQDSINDLARLGQISPKQVETVIVTAHRASGSNSKLYLIDLISRLVQRQVLAAEAVKKLITALDAPPKPAPTNKAREAEKKSDSGCCSVM